MRPTANRRTRVLGAVRALIGLPLALVVVEAGSFHLRNRTDGAIVSSGEKREYLLHVPASYDPTRPTPLVISLHAAAMWPAAQRDMSRWNRVADQHGFIVVYPAGTGRGRSKVWGVSRGDGLERNVRFISDLIDTLMAAYNLDPARVYANGLSNGGGMSFALSCTLSDRIAAVGMVAAAQTLPWSSCLDTRSVPMIAFHGTADSIVPYGGGTSWVSARATFPSIVTWTAGWGRRNRCASSPIETVVAADVTRVEYPECADGAAVVLYRVEGGGHSWPGGGPVPEWLVGSTSDSVDATSLMWEFFREHPLRQAPGAARRTESR